MFCDVFGGFASTLVNISRFREYKEDKRVKLILETIVHSSKEEDDVESREEDTIIFNKGDPSKEGTSKKKDNVTHKAFMP